MRVEWKLQTGRSHPGQWCARPGQGLGAEGACWAETSLLCVLRWADGTRESLTLRRASPAALHVNTLRCGLGVPEASLGAAGPDTHLFPISDAVVREGHGPSSALSGCSGRVCSTCLATATGSRTVGPSGAGRGWLGARCFWTLAAGAFARTECGLTLTWGGVSADPWKGSLE